MRSQRNTGPSLQTKVGPNWQCPQKPTAHFMFRSMEMNVLSAATPRSWSSCTVKRIITSGPQTIATVVRGIEARPG